MQLTTYSIRGLSGTLVTIAAGLLSGCGSSNTTTADNTGGGDKGSTTTSDGGASGAIAGAKKLTGAGATFPYPIYSKWFNSYNQAKGVQINYQDVGSGAGIKQLKNQTVDFGATDAPLDDEKDKDLIDKVVHIPTVAGAVVLAYNLPGAPKGIKMSGEAIANIFLGKTKNWSDPALKALNPGVALPNTPIAVARRSDGSGTTNIFTNYLAAASPEWKTKVGAGKSVNWPIGLGGKGNSGVAGIIKQTPGALGYVELAYAEQSKLPYATIRNASGEFVAPSVDATVAAAQGAVTAVQQDVRAPIANSKGKGAYPIAGFTYILAYKQQQDPAKSAALKEFLKWAITEGQAQAKPLMYAPLPAEVVALNEKTIDSIQ